MVAVLLMGLLLSLGSTARIFRVCNAVVVQMARRRLKAGGFDVSASTEVSSPCSSP